DVRVQEAVGDQLPGRERRVEAAGRPQREAREPRHARIFQDEDRDVRDQQPLRDRRQSGSAPYSTLAPESRTSFSQYGASDFTSASNAAGEGEGVGSMPCTASFSRTSGFASPLPSAACTRATAAGGVPAGANRPNQNVKS